MRRHLALVLAMPALVAGARVIKSSPDGSRHHVTQEHKD